MKYCLYCKGQPKMPNKKRVLESHGIGELFSGIIVLGGWQISPVIMVLEGN
jgi:hypothetical protein